MKKRKGWNSSVMAISMQLDMDLPASLLDKAADGIHAHTTAGNICQLISRGQARVKDR